MKEILVYVLLGLAALGLGLGLATSRPEQASFLFAQEAESGDLVLDEDGTYTVSLSGVSPQTLVFSDRPVRDAFHLPTETFVDAFSDAFRDDPPNAALSYIPAGATEAESAAFTIDSPVYDAEARTLTYRAIDLTMLGAAPEPVSFDDASLFIDSAWVPPWIWQELGMKPPKPPSQ